MGASPDMGSDLRRGVQAAIARGYSGQTLITEPSEQGATVL